MVLGFAMTWQIYWLGVLSFAGILGLIIARLSSKDEHFTISAEEVKKIEESYSKRQQIA